MSNLLGRRWRSWVPSPFPKGSVKVRIEERSGTTMRASSRIRIAGISGGLAVILGALGAHRLQELLHAHDAAAIWETAVFYHLTHSVVLFLTADRNQMRVGPWWSMLAGIIVFSGTLYVLALTEMSWLGAVTPLGGVCLIVAWLWWAITPFCGSSDGPPTANHQSKQHEL